MCVATYFAISSNEKKIISTMKLAELVLPFQKAVLWLYVFGRQHARTLMVNIPKERDHSNENYFKHSV